MSKVLAFAHDARASYRWPALVRSLGAKQRQSLLAAWPELEPIDSEAVIQALGEPAALAQVAAHPGVEVVGLEPEPSAPWWDRIAWAWQRVLVVAAGIPFVLWTGDEFDTRRASLRLVAGVGILCAIGLLIVGFRLAGGSYGR